MAHETQRCPIWRTPVKQIIRDQEGDQVSAVQGAPRTAGDDEMTALALNHVGAMEEREKARVTTRLMEERRTTGQTPWVTPQLITEATRAEPLPVSGRAERLLRDLVTTRTPVGHACITQEIREDAGAFAWTESSTPPEVVSVVRSVMNRRWLTGSMNTCCTITIDGYERVAEQVAKKARSQCCVAMWVDDALDSAYEKGIKRAVEACGDTPVRIDQKEDVNKIDDESMAEIRRRFVVADFTHDESGDRGVVYDEAGFASGLGLEVIYSCRQAPKTDLNVDTRQYHHILWENPEDLHKQLRDRIRARVGDYQAEPPPATL